MRARASTGEPDEARVYESADGGPRIDAREAVDASFLELTRLGVLPADAPLVRQTLAVVDGALRVETPGGAYWRRYPQDGYGEWVADLYNGLENERLYA